MRKFRLWKLHCPAISLPSLPTLSFGIAESPSSSEENMCKSLTTGEWKKVFYEKMEEAKPADSWDLIIDPNLQHNVLAPGWKQYLEQHASGRFHCSWCWHTWQSSQVVILFHMFLDRTQRMGSVRMRVFKQFCYECGTARLDESSMLEENIEGLVDNLICSLREQCYGENGGQYRIHVASRQDNRHHRGDSCEACRMGITHWKPTEKMLDEEATTYTFSRAASPSKTDDSGFSCDFCSIPWCMFWATVLLLIIYLQISFGSPA
ncbi:receptor-transporting protein 1 [Tachyglossus aculeatus]|uniref:receptor-transporting protein 1 n=1 Tax=Tachyglossus aculeatus TaxID=9261 RepID=UPI0018F7BF60|nr:receptor-transporting protein 1 [Tachyglossus aculeatus]